MVRTVDIAPSWPFGRLFARWQKVRAYGRTKAEIEAAVSAFADAPGGPVKVRPSSVAWKVGCLFWVLAVVAGLISIGFGIAFGAVAVLLLILAMRLPYGLASGNAPRYARTAYYGGGGLSLVGLIFLSWGFLFLAGQPEQLSIWAVLAGIGGGLGVMIVGSMISRRAQKSLQPTASELQAHDQRRPIVLLRSFSDDDLTLAGGWDLEEILARELGTFGPFVAIGRPGEPLPEIGAARNYYTDAEWQKAVTKWMDEALALIVLPGLSGGLGWELETIQRRGHIGKLLVFMPSLTHSRKHDGDRYKEDLALQEKDMLKKRWDKLLAAFAGIEAFRTLPKSNPMGLVGMHLASDGVLVLLTGPEIARKKDYDRAVRFAMYGMFCHGHRA